MTEILPGVILPLPTKNILLPFAAIAEVVLYEEPKSMGDMPDWLLGLLPWRGIHIPLTYLERMESYFVWGQQDKKILEENKDKLHIAVVNRITQMQNPEQSHKFNQYPFFSIVLKGIPKLYYISANNIELDSMAEIENSRFIMEVKVQNDNILIPDLVKLWKIIDTLPTRLQWFRQIII